MLASKCEHRWIKLSCGTTDLPLTASCVDHHRWRVIGDWIADRSLIRWQLPQLYIWAAHCSSSVQTTMVNILRYISDSSSLDLFCILLYPVGQLRNSTKATNFFLSVIQLSLSIVLFVIYHCDNSSNADLMGTCRRGRVHLGLGLLLYLQAGTVWGRSDWKIQLSLILNIAFLKKTCPPIVLSSMKSYSDI